KWRSICEHSRESGGDFGAGIGWRFRVERKRRSGLECLRPIGRTREGRGAGRKSQPAAFRSHFSDKLEPPHQLCQIRPLCPGTLEPFLIWPLLQTHAGPGNDLGVAPVLFRSDAKPLEPE